MENDSDMTVTCRQCNKEFTFTKGEQEFYKEKGLTSPHRCKECRSNGKQKPEPILCSKCGKKLGTGAIYCGTCFLADDKLVFEMKTRGQVGADEANPKLNTSEIEKTQSMDEVAAMLSTAESENAELAKLLQQKEQVAAELQERLNNVSLELEEALTNHASYDRIEATLKTMIEKLGALENTQNSLNQTVLQLMSETLLNGSLPEVLNELSGRV